ncbi:hypothetical protein HWC59_gp50 [Proteus phage Myduc]|uniref:Uncharacterized protein n=1 Tax=Proteus phage Myduc TaxID=2650874 RepID=A0A5J6T7P6_9CAUD|nr:hypothetical protein HWC59_gp50 [Proteus phage Myduc]QFG06687.1 hypothetical protein CPT_Myduc_065 [Proteus phage Myduc]
MCTLSQLHDGTYSINDLLVFHEILDLRKELQPEEDKK